MKITETTTRECCQDRDLKKFVPEKVQPFSYKPQNWAFCQHCGRPHCLERVNQGGYPDTIWVAQRWPWEPTAKEEAEERARSIEHAIAP